MRTCPDCGQTFPEVEGVDAQQCPHCGHEVATRAQPGTAATPIDPAGAAAHGFRFWRANLPRLMLVWSPAFAAELIGGVVLALYSSQLGISLEVDVFLDAPLGEQLRLAGLVFPLVILTYGVQLAMWSRVATLVQRGVEANSVAKAPGTGSVFLLGFVLAVAHTAGLIVFIVPFLVFFHWFLFAPAALAGNATNAWSALEASRRFARDRKTAGFTALVLLVYIGAAVLAEFAAAMAFMLAGAQAASITSAVTGWIFNPLVAVLPASFFALAAHAPQAAAAAVRPDASRSERFRTTKCPGCGTLVPYTATGEAVDVTCPVCGRSGRVL